MSLTSAGVPFRSGDKKLSAPSGTGACPDDASPPHVLLRAVAIGDDRD